MAQFIRPVLDITALGAGGSGSYVYIDEASFNDSDYISSNDNTNVTYEAKFSSGSDPTVSGSHIVRWRQAQADTNVAPSSGGTASSYSAYLYQGGTLIATLVSAETSNESSFLAKTYVLTVGESDNITDYTDLRIRFDFSGGGGPAANRRGVAISWAEMELPDVPTFTYEVSMSLDIDSTISNSSIMDMDNSLTLSSDNTLVTTGGKLSEASMSLDIDTTVSSSYEYSVNASVELSISSSIDNTETVDFNPTMTLTVDNSIGDSSISDMNNSTTLTSEHLVDVAGGTIYDYSTTLTADTTVGMIGDLVKIYNESIQLNTTVQIYTINRKSDRLTITNIKTIRNIGKIR